jgi:hypothetical protein
MGPNNLTTLNPAPAGVFFAGDVNAGLLIKPPIGKSEVISNLARLLQDDSVWLERCIDITSHASGVVSHGHRCTANDEHVPYDARRAGRSRAP